MVYRHIKLSKFKGDEKMGINKRTRWRIRNKKKYFNFLYHFPEIGMSPVIPKLYDLSIDAPFHTPFPL